MSQTYHWGPTASDNTDSAAPRARELLARMTIAEKVGQLHQVMGGYHTLGDEVRAGAIGSVINEVDTATLAELQRIAVEESRLGIPLLLGRDVIHGFHTIFPIPLGQAASWNPALIESCAGAAAAEAATVGINWTFAPMIDITRDPRWGRIAESLGEDPYLCGELGAAMVRGFQGQDLAAPGTVAACAKHFAGYGAVEAGIDYNTTNIPESELRNVYLPPFRRALEAGVVTVMAAFTDLNGVPATANEFLMQQVLRDEWGFGGFVVSDWDSISQLSIHGLTADDRAATLAATGASINMDMNSGVYARNLEQLVHEGEVTEEALNELVLPILATKFKLGLFEDPYRGATDLPTTLNTDNLELARRAAQESCVLLKNNAATLPLDSQSLGSLAVIGALADDGYEQLGTWVFDGREADSITCLAALRDRLGPGARLHSARGVKNTRSLDQSGFAEARSAAQASDAVILVLGEEAILSGEAHCRADIGLPGAQSALIDALADCGKPLILVVMAGRPLTLESVIDKVDAILYAWHPGTMAGPAITDILFGDAEPAGKLPVTFPRVVGQIPIYYAHKRTGKPPSHNDVIALEDINARAPQTSLGMSAFHLDAGFTPLFPFGFGLSYSSFSYSELRLSTQELAADEELIVSASLTNTGTRSATEIAQLYIRDPVASLTRPVRELKGFARHTLQPGESRRIEFVLRRQELAFCNARMEWVIEPGEIQLWVGGDANATLGSSFQLL